MAYLLIGFFWGDFEVRNRDLSFNWRGVDFQLRRVGREACKRGRASDGIWGFRIKCGMIEAKQYLWQKSVLF